MITFVTELRISRRVRDLYFVEERKSSGEKRNWEGREKFDVWSAMQVTSEEVRGCLQTNRIDRSRAFFPSFLEHLFFLFRFVNQLFPTSCAIHLRRKVSRWSYWELMFNRETMEWLNCIAIAFRNTTKRLEYFFFFQLAPSISVHSARKYFQW